jgi:hypothetical protein
MTEKRFHAGEQHPEEWRQDLSPDANAGLNYGQAGAQPAGDALTAYDIPELHRSLRGFTDDELKRVSVLPEGARLEQGAVYIDLRTPDPREFKALGNMQAGSGNWLVAKNSVDYIVWNKLIGVENPERLGQADET